MKVSGDINIIADKVLILWFCVVTYDYGHGVEFLISILGTEMIKSTF